MLRSWCLVETMKTNLIKICVWTCDMTSSSYFDKMNSTLGSVVPLAMLTHQVLVKTAILAQNKEGNTSFVAKLLGEDYSVTFWLSYLVALVGTGRQEIIWFWIETKICKQQSILLPFWSEGCWIIGALFGISFEHFFWIYLACVYSLSLITIQELLWSNFWSLGLVTPWEVGNQELKCITLNSYCESEYLRSKYNKII